MDRDHLSVPMDPYSRVEDLIEEGQPLHVGVEVVQLLHSDHLPAATEERRIFLSWNIVKITLFY